MLIGFFKQGAPVKGQPLIKHIFNGFGQAHGCRFVGSQLHTQCFLFGETDGVLFDALSKLFNQHLEQVFERFPGILKRLQGRLEVGFRLLICFLVKTTTKGIEPACTTAKQFGKATQGFIGTLDAQLGRFSDQCSCTWTHWFGLLCFWLCSGRCRGGFRFGNWWGCRLLLLAFGQLSRGFIKQG